MSDHVTAQDGSRVYPWPPRIEPATSKGKKLMQSLLKTDEDEPLWDLAKQFPGMVRSVGRSLGWKIPFLFYPSPSRLVHLHRRSRGLVHLMVYQSPDTLAALRSFAQEAAVRRDKDILALMDYPPSDALVRILGRLSDDVLNPVLTPFVVELWTKQAWMRKYFQHLPAVSHDVLQVIQMGQRVAGWHLLHEAAMSPPGQSPVAFSVRMLASLWKETGEAGWPYTNLHADEVHNAIAKLQIAKTRDILYPDPPVHGAHWIKPIRTPRELLDEGRRMRNCSFTFDQAVQEGRVFLYRVKSPKCICTALLKRVDAGIQQTGQVIQYWALGECRTYDNHPPSKQVIAELMHWLQAAFPHCTQEMLDQRVQVGGEWCEELGWQEPDDFF